MMVIIIDLQILQYKMAFPYWMFHHKIYMLDLYGQLYSTTRLTLVISYSDGSDPPRYALACTRDKPLKA